MSTTLSEADLKKKIDLFSSLEYKKGRYRQRNWGHPLHSLCSYPSKLKPSIAYFLVDIFTQESQTILDPFSGVGTLPFEACEQGRVGIGSDINPLAFHVTRAKVDRLSDEEIRKQTDELGRFIAENKTSSTDEAEEEIIPFYHPDTLKEILAARRFFQLRREENVSFVMACILHILHGNRPYALSRRSHNIMPWPPKGPTIYKPVAKLVREKVERMLAETLPLTYVKGQAIQDDVFNLSIPNASVDCILTSPPFYVNRDFVRMNRLRLWFCGWDYKRQAEMKASFLESQKDIAIYDKVFAEFGRVLKPRSICVMHLGVVKKMDMAKDLTPHAEKRSFDAFEPIYEDTSKLESHGIVDRGATSKHQFLVLRKRE